MSHSIIHFTVVQSRQRRQLDQSYQPPNIVFNAGLPVYNGEVSHPSLTIIRMKLLCAKNNLWSTSKIVRLDRPQHKGNRVEIMYWPVDLGCSLPSLQWLRSALAFRMWPMWRSVDEQSSLTFRRSNLPHLQHRVSEAYMQQQADGWLTLSIIRRWRTKQSRYDTRVN
jgi:hypothetical protein